MIGRPSHGVGEIARAEEGNLKEIGEEIGGWRGSSRSTQVVSPSCSARLASARTHLSAQVAPISGGKGWIAASGI